MAWDSLYSESTSGTRKVAHFYLADVVAQDAFNFDLSKDGKSICHNISRKDLTELYNSIGNLLWPGSTPLNPVQSEPPKEVLVTVKVDASELDAAIKKIGELNAVR